MLSGIAFKECLQIEVWICDFTFLYVTNFGECLWVSSERFAAPVFLAWNINIKYLFQYNSNYMAFNGFKDFIGVVFLSNIIHKIVFLHQINDG